MQRAQQTVGAAVRWATDDSFSRQDRREAIFENCSYETIMTALRWLAMAALRHQPPREGVYRNGWRPRGESRFASVLSGRVGSHSAIAQCGKRQCKGRGAFDSLQTGNPAETREGGCATQQSGCGLFPRHRHLHFDSMPSTPPFDGAAPPSQKRTLQNSLKCPS